MRLRSSVAHHYAFFFFLQDEYLEVALSHAPKMERPDTHFMLFYNVLKPIKTTAGDANKKWLSLRGIEQRAWSHLHKKKMRLFRCEVWYPETLRSFPFCLWFQEYTLKKRTLLCLFSLRVLRVNDMAEIFPYPTEKPT